MEVDIIQRAVPDLPVGFDRIRSLSGLNPARSLTAIFIEWLIIALAIAIHVYFTSPVAYFIVWILIGTRMYALYSLLHDGIHYLLSPQRRVNDWISKMLLAWPLFVSLKGIRKRHLAHHQYLKTDNDPELAHLQYTEFQFPKTGLELAIIFLMDLTGINFIYYRIKKLFFSMKHVNRSENKNLVRAGIETGMVAYYFIIFAAILYLGLGTKFLLYWFIPYISIYQALNRLRLATEHSHIPGDKFFQTRTVRLNAFEKFIISPHNLSYHAEHHLYPGVPFYHLPGLHHILKDNSQFKNNVTIDSGYLEVIKKYIK